MIDPLPIYLIKAEESLRGAESEFAQGRYNNAANRCYYACFQAARALQQTHDFFAAIREQVRAHESGTT